MTIVTIFSHHIVTTKTTGSMNKMISHLPVTFATHKLRVAFSGLKLRWSCFLKDIVMLKLKLRLNVTWLCTYNMVKYRIMQLWSVICGSLAVKFHNKNSGKFSYRTYCIQLSLLATVFHTSRPHKKSLVTQLQQVSNTWSRSYTHINSTHWSTGTCKINKFFNCLAVNLIYVIHVEF